MKKLLLILFLSPLFSIAQSIPKSSNTIIVHQTDLKTIVQGIESRGYNVAYDGFNTLTTIPLRLTNPKGPQGVIMFTIKITDSVSYVTGLFENRTITYDLFDLKESYGGKNLAGSFVEMFQVARTFGNKISYATMEIKRL